MGEHMKPNWKEKAVIRLLSKMDQGRLNLTLASGQVLKFGSRIDSEVTQKTANIQILSNNFFNRCILYGDIGFGESYVAGEWQTSDVSDVISWMIQNREKNPGVSGSSISSLALGVLRGANRIKHLLCNNSIVGSKKNISAHYDLSNDFFKLILDSSMTYSCADYSNGAKTLEEAQLAKFERLADAAKIRPGLNVLEVGSGWGAFAVYLAKIRGCKVKTVTVSKMQLKVVQEKIKNEGLQDVVDVELCDYRDVQGQFDRIVSVEMLEAVGAKHFQSFFSSMSRVLTQNGLLAVQVITSADSRFEELKNGVDWIQKHIFPGSLLPSIAALTTSAQKVSALQIHSLFSLGSNYATTLSEWRRRFNKNLLAIRNLGFDEQRIRMWNYYFCYCEAAFASRHINVVQIVYTQPNNLEV
jgi:cyclopropane-fatty-acyl-phospholipid synthase